MAGLKRKYMVMKPDGSPADRHGMYFVLKLNSDHERHARASQAAALVYAEIIEEDIPELSADLRATVMQLRDEGSSPLWDGRVKLPPLPNLYQRALDIIANWLHCGDDMSALAQSVLDGKTELLEAAEEQRDR